MTATGLPQGRLRSGSQPDRGSERLQTLVIQQAGARGGAVGCDSLYVASTWVGVQAPLPRPSSRDPIGVPARVLW